MENQVIKSGLKNTIFVVLAQAVSFVLGIAKALILPIILGVTNFGYWQVYLLYLSYVGLFALGFNDGIYLRYGKYSYEDLPKPVFRTSIRLFMIIQLIITFVVLLIINLEPDANKKVAMIWASINIPIAGLTGVLIYILQTTNQLKKYSFYTVLDKIVILVIIGIIFIFKIEGFIFVIVADTLSKIVVLALMAYSCKDIIVGKGCGIKHAYDEIFENINVGIKLMLANLAGMLILGFGRFIVERFESIEVYSAYSFAISTINLVLIFITAIGLVIYPTLGRLDEKSYSKYFTSINEVLSILVFGLLLIYFPLYVFINNGMKEYVQIFEYLPITFSILFIQTKMQILINPYYKLLREEKEMLRANVIGLLMAMALIVPLYYIYRSVSVIALGTFLAMGVRLYLSEFYLKKKLAIKKNVNILIEIFGTLIFIILAYQNNKLFGFTGYFIFFILYTLVHKNIIIKFLKSIASIRGR